MIRFSRALWASCLLCVVSYAQPAAPSLTADEISFFNGLLQKLGGVDLSLAIRQREERALAELLRLNAAESAVLHAAALSFNASLGQLRQSELAIMSGSRDLTDSDRSQIAVLVGKRDLAVSTIASTLLGSVRPETALQLRKNAQMIAHLIARKGAQ